MTVVEPKNMNRTSVEPAPAYNPVPSTYEENPLYETARWMLLLTFNDFIFLATKVKKKGYNPPTTPFELANLLNDWAISECRTETLTPLSGTGGADLSAIQQGVTSTQCLVRYPERRHRY